MAWDGFHQISKIIHIQRLKQKSQNDQTKCAFERLLKRSQSFFYMLRVNHKLEYT